MEIGIRKLRERLGSVLEAVESGEEVVITRRGTEVARIVPSPRPGGKRLPSLADFRASIEVTGRPLSEEVIAARAEEPY